MDSGFWRNVGNILIALILSPYARRIVWLSLKRRVSICRVLVELAFALTGGWLFAPFLPPTKEASHHIEQYHEPWIFPDECGNTPCTKTNTNTTRLCCIEPPTPTKTEAQNYFIEQDFLETYHGR